MAGYEPHCEISEISDTDELQFPAPQTSTYQFDDHNSSETTPFAYGIPQDSSQLHTIPEGNGTNPETAGSSEKEFDKKNWETAEEIVKIRESVQLAGEQAVQNMFDRRNQANREWQEMDMAGRAERKQAVLETVAAIQDIQDFTEEEIKAQEEALAKYKSQMDEQKQALQMQAKAQEHNLLTNHQGRMSSLEKAGNREERKAQNRTAEVKAAAREEIVGVQEYENTRRAQMNSKHDQEIERLRRETELILEAEKLKQSELSKPKNKEKEFGKKNWETAEEIVKIRESVQQAGEQDFTEEEIKAQEEALAKYKSPMDEQKQALQMQANTQEHNLLTNHQGRMSPLEKAGNREERETQNRTAEVKAAAREEIVRVQESENTRMAQMNSKHDQGTELILEPERLKRSELSKPKKTCRIV